MRCIAGILALVSVAALAQDEFDGLSCEKNMDIPKALIGRESRDQDPGDLMLRHSDIGLRNLWADGGDPGDTYMLEAWEICGKYYIMLLPPHDPTTISDVIPMPQEWTERTFLLPGADCVQSGKKVETPMIVIMKRGSDADAETVVELDLNKFKLHVKPAPGMRCESKDHG